MADQLDPRSVHGRSLPVLSISGGPFGKLLPLAAQAAPSCVTGAGDDGQAIAAQKSCLKSGFEPEHDAVTVRALWST